MATFILPHNNYPRESDVFQGLSEGTYGYVRKTVTVTAPAGTTLYIGHILVDNGDGTASVPTSGTDLADLVSPVKLCVYVGNDHYKLQNSDDLGFNDNYSNFVAGALTQEVCVVWRGQGGIAKNGLIYPAGTTANEKKAIQEKLTVENNFKILRQAFSKNV